MCTHKCLCVYLVEPGDDRILSVIRQLLDVSVTVRGSIRGVSVDAGHHPLHTHHLHSIRHHQRVNEGQVGTLQRHTTVIRVALDSPASFQKRKTDWLFCHVGASVCVCTSLCWHLMGDKDTEIICRAGSQELNLHLFIHWLHTGNLLWTRCFWDLKISPSPPWWCFLHFAFPLNVCTCRAPLTVNARCKFDSFTSTSYSHQHLHKAWHSPGLSSQTPGQSDQPPPTPSLSCHTIGLLKNTPLRMSVCALLVLTITSTI